VGVVNTILADIHKLALNIPEHRGGIIAGTEPTEFVKMLSLLTVDISADWYRDFLDGKMWWHVKFGEMADGVPVIESFSIEEKEPEGWQKNAR
jgi:hypothetical protein